MVYRTAKKWVFFGVAIVLLMAMVGCNLPKKVFDYDNKSNITDVKEQDVTEKIKQLAYPNEVQMARSICYDMNSLKAEGIVQIVRFNKNRYYSITPIKGNKYLFLLYSETAEPYYVVDGYLTSGFANKDNFKDIQVGISREEIISKDSNVCVCDNYSYHRFADGSILTIKYDVDTTNKYVVSDYYYSDQPESVVNYLLPQDYELLS